jgi:SAM-dependent methyltransferase
MSETSTRAFDQYLEDGRKASGEAPRLAAAAALLEMGDRLGVLNLIGSGEKFSVAELAATGDLHKAGVAAYCEALEAAALIRATDQQAEVFVAAPDFDIIQHQAGFISWALNANRPFIERAREFLNDRTIESGTPLRDGREVAVSSQWMGAKAFYPVALSAIRDFAPAVAVDLGAGTCRLLIEILQSVPNSRAVGLDIDGGACQEAAEAARRAGVADRLTIMERSIQSIADDPRPLEGAQVIHGGFVFHDMMPFEEEIAEKVLANCCVALEAGGLLAITEAVPYVSNEHERYFSALVTYYHQEFMKRRLLSEEEWKQKLLAAGFATVESIVLAFPTGRLFLARKAER